VNVTSHPPVPKEGVPKQVDAAYNALQRWPHIDVNGELSRNPGPQSGGSLASSKLRYRRTGKQEAIMNEDVFNASIRKFLKTLGVSAQREIEKAVRQALSEGRLKGNEKVPAAATVTLGAVGLTHEIKGEIELG
jgi:hypothetical protein